MPKPTRTPMPNERIELPNGCHLQYYKEVGDVAYFHLCQANGQHFIDTMLSEDEARNLAAALQSPAGEWRAIETAPIDVEILVYVPHEIKANERHLDGSVIIARKLKFTDHESWECDCIESESGYYNDCYHNHAPIKPTHWMPLPPSPTGEV